MEELDWDTPFHPVYGCITMEPNKFVYYRGYDMSYPPISDRPSYYGSFATAKGYADISGRTMNAFTNKFPLRLIDIRFMKDILRELFSTNSPDKDTLSVILSFGLCSLYHQCNLAKERFTPPEIKNNLNALIKYYNSNTIPNFEQHGYRIAETTNDACTMAFLKTIFEGFVDGFISPKQYSPFHIEKDTILNAELIIFNPEKSQIKMLYEYIPKFDVLPKNIDSLYKNQYSTQIHLGNPKYDYTIYTKSGGGHIDTILPSVEQIQYEWNTNPEIQENWKNGEKAGQRWKTIAQFGLSTNPHPIASELGDWNTTQIPTRSIDSVSMPTILSKIDECLTLLKSTSEPKRRLSRKNIKNTYPYTFSHLKRRDERINVEKEYSV
jgi:hypothetical protein